MHHEYMSIIVQQDATIHSLPLWLNRAFLDQLIVYYQQMHLILFNVKCLKQ
jgi:hypothetical protein